MGDVMAAPYFLAAALLVLSGVAKVRRPGPASRALAAAGLPSGWGTVRVLGTAEFAVGALAVALPNPPVAMALAAFYGAFALFVGYVLAARIPAASCGCAGGREAPPSILHVVLDLFAAAAAVVIAYDPPPNVVRFALGAPLHGLPLVALLGATGYLAVLATSLRPDLRRLVSASFRIGHDHASATSATIRPAVFHLTEPGR